MDSLGKTTASFRITVVADEASTLLTLREALSQALRDAGLANYLLESQLARLDAEGEALDQLAGAGPGGYGA